MRSMLFALVRKELFLVFHPMTLVVLGLSALVLVPNWPYAVILLYACLCPYFNAQSAREQRDLDFAATLPASRRDMAAARVLATALVEAACVVLMLAFSLARPLAGAPDAFVGMPPNLAFLGFSLATFAVFDLAFFALYYRDPSKVGLPFAAASVPALLVMLAFEAAPYLSPQFASLLAQPGFANLGAQLAVLGVGALLFLLGHLAAARLAGRSFERVDI